MTLFILILSTFASLFLVIVAFSFIAAWQLDRRYPELHWDWSKIPGEVPQFPAGFLWGVAAAAHQVEGGNDNNNWSAWEKALDSKGKPRIRGGHVAGLACDHWNRYREDIALMKELGVRAYRLSMEWSRIVPSEGAWDEASIQHYHKIIDAVIEAGIQPVITLHHFTSPLWFEEKGGFMKRENLRYFVSFSERLFQEFRPKVEMWCTLNEPEVFASQGWFLGLFPPGHHSPRETAEVLRNLLIAHVEVYRALKALPGGDTSRIGLVKNIFQFDPARRWFLPEWIASIVFDRIFNAAVLDTFKNNRFTASIFPLVSVDEPIPGASETLDFIGLNYYSHYRIKFQASLSEPIAFGSRPGDVMTDMPYPVYPEGFYRALKQIGELQRPIYITENGVSDAKDDFRELFIQRYLIALRRFMSEGGDVRGFFYWSLMDNFEWCEGWYQKFGLYSMDPEIRERRFRQGSSIFREVVQATPEP